MATPTQRITARVEGFLGEEVVIALRVKPPTSTPPGKRAAKAAGGVAALLALAQLVPYAEMVFTGFVAAGSRLRYWRNGQDSDEQLLALTASGGRVLIGRTMLGRVRPIGSVQRLTHNAPLVGSVERLSEAAEPILTIAGHTFQVNNYDFNKLLKAVFENGYPAPEFKKEFAAFYRHRKALRTQEPNSMRKQTSRGSSSSQRISN